MQKTALSQLVVWHGIPSQIFPEGEHCFPADLGRLDSLVEAWRADLDETHLVPVAVLGLEAERPLRLVQLRAFLATHRARLSAVLVHVVVTANSLAHGASRRATLRAMNAPEVIVEDCAAELARVAAKGWEPAIDLAAGPDAVATASVVDVAYRTEHDEPLADIAPLVLLALHCCIETNESSVHPPWLDEVEWTPIPMESESEDPVPADVVRVRPAVYADTLEELSFADVSGLAAAGAIAPGGALLRIFVTSDDEDES